MASTSNTPQRQMPHFSSVIFQTVTPAVIATAGAATYTAAQVYGGEIRRATNGAGRTDTLPTAAQMVAAVSGLAVNSMFEFIVRNDASAAETITIAAGTGGTTSGTMTVAQNNMKRFRVRFTNVDLGTEAYEVQSLGAVTF